MTDQQLIGALLRLKVETGSLACAGCGHEHNCSLQGCNILREAVAAIREKEERRWIPVTERLPDIGQKCLIANREIVVRGWLRPDGVWKTGVSSDEIWSKFSLYQPTHWMPLPEPPKGE